MATKFSEIILFNRAGADTRMFDAAILDCIRNSKPLPDEIADLFTLTPVEVADGTRFVLDWA